MSEWEDGIAEVEAATRRLDATLAGLTDDEVRGPSLCTGWSRGHVLAHITHNAEGMRNLVRWARTDVETRMYPSREARDAAIERDASRPLADHRHHVAAAAAALVGDLRTLPGERLATVVATQPGREFPAAELPWRRLREVEIHHVDLDAGYGHENWTAAFVERCLDDVVAMLAARAEPPAVIVRSSDRGREWRLGGDAAGTPTVSGPESSLLAWLSGRSVGDDLTVAPPGPLPIPPAWL